MGGFELGAQTSYTCKEGQGERAIINGHHETSVFTELLDKFIMKYVCCENCRLPEIDIWVKKGAVGGKCLACGWNGELDNMHKLASFISKYPPDASQCNIKMDSEGDATLDKKARRAAKLLKRQAEGEQSGSDHDDTASE